MADNVPQNINNASQAIQELIKEALEKSLQTIENQAKRECPVDDGQLRASITHKTDQFKGVVGTNTEYAAYVHEGTGIFVSGGRTTPWTYKSADGKFHRTSGQKGKPFLKDALESEKTKVEQIFKDVCKVENIRMGGI